MQYAKRFLNRYAALQAIQKVKEKHGIDICESGMLNGVYFSACAQPSTWQNALEISNQTMWWTSIFIMHLKRWRFERVSCRDALPATKI